MKETGILFSGPMVRAILADLKTQTRRPVKGNALAWLEEGFTPEFVGSPANNLCPFGVPGDRLWVREAWRPWGWREDGPIAVQFRADGARMRDSYDPFTMSGDYESWYEKIAVQATEECEKAGLPMDGEGCYHWPNGECPLKWHPSIHMPRWASRITLEVTDARVERVQSITEEDARREGFTDSAEWVGGEGRVGYSQFSSARDAFLESFNRTYPGSVERNDWVWVVSFRRLA